MPPAPQRLRTVISPAEYPAQAPAGPITALVVGSVAAPMQIV